MNVTPAELEGLLKPYGDFDARPVVEYLVSFARKSGSSDLHIRPSLSGVEILLRRDGVLRVHMLLPGETRERLTVGLKNMARLASYRKSVPQDGRMEIHGTEIRVAVTPTHFGEKAVLRIVHQDDRLLALQELGFSPGEESALLRVLDTPQGLVLATGPAGSGKTTTLYASLKWLYARHRERMEPMHDAALNVVTLEDPIECVIPEFTQTQLDPAMGMTFASGLRSLLRQDPDIILVGEIRDRETAEATVKCSLTGHLALSTLHTRDSIGVIPRLLEMGIEPYLLAASLGGVIYQRLIRKLCPKCKIEHSPSEEYLLELKALGLPAGSNFVASGCENCDRTGYLERTAVAEVLEVDDRIRQGILDGISLRDLCSQAEQGGMITLRKAALSRVAEGETTYDEVYRVVPR